MKFRYAIIPALAAFAFLLAACNFTMAADVTPPPNYVPPTPAPTMGPLFPAQTPSTENGAAIFAEKCAGCHGSTGLGDGEQGIQLGVPVPAFGLPEVARPASPAQWYTMVTQGNMERFMPPFNSLNDQQRWDVVAYAMTLHITEQDLATGQELFEANCQNCSTDFFRDQAAMSELSEVELARIVKEGNDQVPPFGAALSEEDLWAVTAYLRTLSFDTGPLVAAPASTPTSQPVAGTETLSTADASTPGTESTPMGTAVAAESTGAARAGVGTVSGSIENKTGADLPSDLTVTLRAYEHGADPNTGPQEVFSREIAVEGNSFVLEDIEIPVNRIFRAELNFNGMDYVSDFAIVREGDTAVTLSPITLYNQTADTSKLVVDETRIFFEYGDESILVYNVYSFRNPTDEMIVVEFSGNGDIPFIKAPDGVTGFTYEPMQDSEPFLDTPDGFAIRPSEGSYGVIAFGSLPKAKEFDYGQEFVLPAENVTVFVPEGITVKSDKSTDLGVQAIQDFNFQIYELGRVTPGEKLNLQVSGVPKEPGNATAPGAANSNQNLLIGAGALGLALILAGAWMYWRERNATEEETESEEEDKFESADDVLDAIVTLDDLHRGKKITDEAYQKRRAELKEILKEKM